MTFPTSDWRGRASCRKRTSNISIWSAARECDIFCFPNFSFQPGVRTPDQEKRTAPRMVLTSSCQFLMIFRYVMEFEGLVYVSPRRTWPRERVRVSKRLIVPLREPVNTRNWLIWRSERDGICSRYACAYLFLVQRKDVTFCFQAPSGCQTLYVLHEQGALSHTWALP